MALRGSKDELDKAAGWHVPSEGRWGKGHMQGQPVPRVVRFRVLGFQDSLGL